MFYLMCSKTRHAELRLITGCISGMLPVALALLPSAVCMFVQNDVLFFFWNYSMMNYAHPGLRLFHTIPCYDVLPVMQMSRRCILNFHRGFEDL